MLACDEACMAWKSQRICSHVLAAAVKMECLCDFLSSLKRSKIMSNYSAVCTHDLPKSVGKKPGNPKRKGPAQKRPEIESVQTGTPISSSLAMSNIHLATAQLYAASNSINSYYSYAILIWV